MSTPILSTKLYIPPPRPLAVQRSRLLARLNSGLHRKLTLISAPAGFGKTTLLAAWLLPRGAATAAPSHPSSVPFQRAWLSLDAGDSDLARFLAYLVAALQIVAPGFGGGVLALLQSPQLPPTEALLTPLLNDLANLAEPCVLVLDDYHLIDDPAIDRALAFLLDHLPSHLHLVIATRADPPLPLARLRARDQLTELRAADLRFTLAEAGDFLGQVMGLQLADETIAALEARTEGWIAGLQLAALSMQHHADVAGFLAAFTGSHQFVIDYLLEEVLHQQSSEVQDFLLRTSILERLCGPLCDALLDLPTGSAQATLEYLERANLFLIALDPQRRWYRYHHLFADLLRQRLQHHGADRAALHIRASSWYEQNGLELEAFQHATAADDIDRAARLLEGSGTPLHFRGAAAPVLRWLESLSPAALAARPALRVTYAITLSIAGRNSQVAANLNAAETALDNAEIDAQTRNLRGQIAAMRAMLAAPQYQVDIIIDQAGRALADLHPCNLPLRSMATWTLGMAYKYQGDRAAARRAYQDAIALCETSGNRFINVLAGTGLGQIQESDLDFVAAEQSYRRVLALVGEPLLPMACEACFGLARLAYERNDLATAEHYVQLSIELARRIESIDSAVSAELFLVRLRLAQGELAAAAVVLAEAARSIREHHYEQQRPPLVAVQVLLLLHQGDPAAAATLAHTEDIPLSQARVALAMSDPARALELLEPQRRQAETRNWPDQQLQVLMLEALTLRAQGAGARALQRLAAALALAEHSGCIRSFVDAGPPMADLLARFEQGSGRMQPYVQTLLQAFALPKTQLPTGRITSPFSEPLSPREIEILRLIAQGLSNREIGARLVLALDTVKGHNRRIFEKLQVQRRTEAIVRARELGLV